MTLWEVAVLWILSFWETDDEPDPDYPWCGGS